MNQPYRSRSVQVIIARVFSGAFAAALVLSGATTAEAATQARTERGPTIYTLRATQRRLDLCPDETRALPVTLTKQVTRMVGGEAVVARPQNVRGVSITSREFISTGVVSVTPSQAQTGPSGSASFTVKALRNGRGHVSFTAQGLTSPSAVLDLGVAGGGMTDVGLEVAADVHCAFKVTLTGKWTLAEQVTQHARMDIENVGLSPDENGSFAVDARMSDRVARSGPCGGSSSASSPQAHFLGQVYADRKLHLEVIFDPVATRGVEGCKGKGYSGTSQLDSLLIDVDISDGAPSYSFMMSHLLTADGRAYTGTTEVYIERVQD